MIQLPIDPVAQAQDAMKGAFVSGGLMLMAIGALVAWLRSFPAKLFSWLLNRFSVQAEVLNQDSAFEWISVWLDELPYAKRARSLTARGRHHDEGAFVELTPAPGNHFFLLGWRPVWLSRVREGGGEKSAGYETVRRETISLRVLGRSQDAMRRLFAEAKKSYDKRYEEAAALFLFHQGAWSHMGPLPDRPLESVVLPGDTIPVLHADMSEFLGARLWYGERGVPWRRCYMLHGPPGTGKTSLIIALARSLNLSVYFMNLSACHSDNVLQAAFMGVGPKSILVLEDIDAAVDQTNVPNPADREQRAETPSAPNDLAGSITLSGLLQALDGIMTRDGRLTVMTTNYPERLDPRVIRPGRVDSWHELGYATPQQASEMFRRFYPQVAQMSEMFIARLPRRDITPADIQAHLLLHRKQPEQAVREADRIGADPMRSDLAVA